MAYCEGPGKWFDSDIELLRNNGLSTTEATVAAVFTHYNPYDTLKINTTSGSYLIKAVQYALRDAGCPVTLTGGFDQPTDNCLDKIFNTDWKTIPWDEILKTIEANKDTLVQQTIAKAPVAAPEFKIGWKHVAIGVGALFALKGLLK